MMQEYFIIGYWKLINSLEIAVILYVVLSVILAIIKKRNYKKVKKLPFGKMALEFLFLWYVCAILKITGIIGLTFGLDFRGGELGCLFSVPFVGNSIKMIMLNFLLFVPYGFLLLFVFPKIKWNWKFALLIGACSSLVIELLQVVGGRLCEIDDLITNSCGVLVGYLLAQSCKRILLHEQAKKGVIQGMVTVIISGFFLVLISFLANGDVIQQQMDEYYNEISNDNALEDIIVFKIYNGKKELDVAHCSEYDWETWYRWMGDSIDSNASFYKWWSENAKTSDIIEQQDNTYIEIVFSNNQEFLLENNEDWTLEHIKHLLYCIEDGNFWYGSKEDTLEYCASYEDIENAFQIDKNLLEEIQEAVRE
ncbi:MAG: VanZ family protein [Clostridiales bacterium]|nr:VanZ family protein [Clostridiales bacterium]